MREYLGIEDLLHKTLTNIIVNENNNEIIFVVDEKTKYMMYHEQDCCEIVYIEDICGDLTDLLNTPILLAECVDYEPTNEEDIEKTKGVNEWGSCTWTFYKLATINGFVTFRWFGESNGYYSEGVDFVKL